MKVTSAKKIGYIPALIVFIVVFLLGGIMFAASISFGKQEIPESYVETEATIERIDEEQDIDDEWIYTVYIGYEFNNKTYTNLEYGSYVSSMKQGDHVTVYVDPESPEDFVYDSDFDLIFPIISGIFTIIGLVGIVYNIKGLKNLKRS